MVRRLTGYSYQLSIPKEGYTLDLIEGCPSSVVCYLPSKSFTFLNQSHTFKDHIDWNFNKYGKLWAYNLNYFDYLNQPGISEEEGLELIWEFIDGIEDNNEGLEPYPISLRAINWIKFLSQYNVRDSSIDASLYAQYQVLLDNLEYHLLGNHLLENSCSLLFGAYYFQDEAMYVKSKQILLEQIEEQILADGGHFERSTMYHCILLERLLDCYSVVTGNEWVEDQELKELLKDKAELMLGWLEAMTVDGGRLTDEEASTVVPLLNDAAKGIGSEPLELFDYADRLGLGGTYIELGESGYRRYSTGKLDLICDVGAVGPDYQPGHAHSDTFSFVLYKAGKPVLIDPGISTYENNSRRQLERSTQFHNTVQVKNVEQSEIWSAFRMGQRASINKIDERQTNEEVVLTSSHDGYRNLGIVHKRTWSINKGNDQIVIQDRLTGQTNSQSYLNLHFSPFWSDKIHVENQKIRLGDIEISFEGEENVKKQAFNCPNGYNRYIKCDKITARFVGKITTTITLAP